MICRTFVPLALTFPFWTGCAATAAQAPAPQPAIAPPAAAPAVPVVDERQPPPSDLAPCDAARVRAWARVDAVANTTMEVLAAHSPNAHVARIDASAGGMQAAATAPFVFLNLNQPTAPVPLTDVQAATSQQWHIALKRTTIRINSADSGPGSLRLARITGVWPEPGALPESLSTPQSLTWATDLSVDEQCEVLRDPIGQTWTAIHTLNEDNPSGSHSWYHYGPDGVTVPADVLYIVHDPANSGAWLLQIVDWQDGVWTLRWQPLDEARLNTAGLR